MGRSYLPEISDECWFNEILVYWLRTHCFNLIQASYTFLISKIHNFQGTFVRLFQEYFEIIPQRNKGAFSNQSSER